jgi:hypothetical protein
LPVVVERLPPLTAEHGTGRHLNVYGQLAVSRVLSPVRPRSRAHFPTGRVSVGAGIRLLVDEFAVPAAADGWRHCSP